MDFLILNLLRVLRKPIRLPTAQWLFSDLFGLLDCEVRERLTDLEESGLITIDNGGWIKASGIED